MSSKVFCDRAEYLVFMTRIKLAGPSALEGDLRGSSRYKLNEPSEPCVNEYIRTMKAKPEDRWQPELDPQRYGDVAAMQPT